MCWGRASYYPDAHCEPLLWILLVIIITENEYHFIFYNSRQRLLATGFFPKNQLIKSVNKVVLGL